MNGLNSKSEYVLYFPFFPFLFMNNKIILCYTIRIIHNFQKLTFINDWYYNRFLQLSHEIFKLCYIAFCVEMIYFLRYTVTACR